MWAKNDTRWANNGRAKGLNYRSREKRFVARRTYSERSRRDLARCHCNRSCCLSLWPQDAYELKANRYGKRTVIWSRYMDPHRYRYICDALCDPGSTGRSYSSEQNIKVTDIDSDSECSATKSNGTRNKIRGTDRRDVLGTPRYRYVAWYREKEVMQRGRKAYLIRSTLENHQHESHRPLRFVAPMAP